ncbi:bacterial Ig-like domain-containing protein [Clostridium boliviensis]|uniref:Bacterial Ig-like domain-containing protein n=1 Tax=Clostridium boliviensis TaxID=318465 RepID=A0ABU4GPU3_9CLOT|nr:bacterial Ig-like domain-containing protein [Clostridium boliviensis]MDW2799638.1 bacterial Ig-like domain-containing protein [Clostridium boliviensis]
MVLNKKSRFLSGVLIAALLITAVPVYVYGETGELLSSNDHDASSIADWIGKSIDTESNFDFTSIFPNADWYQYNDLNLVAEPSPKDRNDNDEKNEIIEYSAAYDSKTTDVGKIYKDYILSTPGYYNLNASVQVFPYMNADKGAIRIELYDNTEGSGVPVGSSYEVSKSSAGINTGNPAWETVTAPVLYVKSKVKMIRVILEASVTYPDDASDFVDFDGLSVILTQAPAPPIISNLNSDLVTYTEDEMPVPLDQDQNVTVKVDDSFGRTYETGSVTASITSNVVASEDVLELTQTGGITLSGDNVSYNGTPIGTYLAGGTGMNLTVSLNANASDTSVAALLKAIVYKNTNAANPNINPRTVMVSVSDNFNASEPVYTTVQVQRVNDAPVRRSGIGASSTNSIPVKTPYNLDLGTIFEDPDTDPLNYKVKVNDNAEEIINKDYTFTPTATGSYTLVFKAYDGNDESTDTYTVTLNVKQPNRAPVRKSGLEESMSITTPVNSQFYIGLENVFVDPDDDPLTFMVKIDDNPEVSADDHFNYTVTSAGSHTLVFKAYDGMLESTETYAILITATKVPLRSVTQPDAVTGIPNGSAKTAAALGLPETVSLVTSSGLKDADVTWNVAACTYDPDQEPEQTFDVEGTVSLPDYISNPDGISLDVTVRVTVKSKLPADMTLVSIVPVTPITGIPNGSVKTVSSLQLPDNVILETDQGTVSTGVTWNVAACSYDPDQKAAQTFEVEGTINLPAKVVNPDGVSLSVTAEVTVDAESLTDKTLKRIYSISPVKGITNGTAKTLTALGIPAKVLLGTDDGNVQADVDWDLDSSSYDPGLSEEQIFTIDGTVELPDNVINPAGIPLEVTVEVTVLEEEAEQEYYTLRIRVAKRPDKVSYTLGEDLDTQGLEVTEYQKASPSNAVRKIALSEDQYDLEYNLARTGTRHVKVIYYGTDRNGNEKEFKDEFTVRVKEPPRDHNSDDDDDDREIIEPGWKSTGGDEDHYYPGTWKQDDTGWRLSGKDGSRVANRWVYTDWSGSKDWYFFDEKGYLVTGWFDYKGNVYYLNPVSDGKKGSMYTGWNMIDGKWYYFSEAADGTKGSMLRNTGTSDGHRVGPDGARIS